MGEFVPGEMFLPSASVLALIALVGLVSRVDHLVLHKLACCRALQRTFRADKPLLTCMCEFVAGEICLPCKLVVALVTLVKLMSEFVGGES